ncbi:MAG: sugar ABC transporter permease [Actinobacteria bacterium]|nr:sugar ABC transporter permease [Actinomycetota bacterium]
MLPGTLVFVVFILLPLLAVLATSFTDWNARTMSFTWVENYRRLVSDDVLWGALRNTTAYGAVGVFIQIPLGVAAGIILAQRIQGWKAFRAILFLPVVISGAALALIFANFYNPRYGLLNWILGFFGYAGTDWLFDIDTSLWAVAGTFAFSVGFFMVLVMTEIASIPGEILEAAEVDGASGWQRQTLIVLPLLRHVIGTCVLLSLLSTLGFFDLVYILTAGGPANSTVTLALYAYRLYTSSDWGYANAVGVLIVLIGFVLIVGMRKLFQLGDRWAN